MLSKRNLIKYICPAIIVAIFCFIKLFLFTCEGGVASSNCKTELFDVKKELIGIKADDYEYFGFMDLTKENISNFKLPFAFNNTLRYPGGFNYEYGFDGAFPIVIGAILGFFMNLVTSYNLVIFIILFLDIYVSYIYFVKISNLTKNNDNLVASLIAAFIFGASPYVFSRLNSHLNLSVIFGFPILILGLIELLSAFKHDLMSKIIPKAISHIYLGVIFILLGSLQFAVIISLIFISYIVYVFAMYRHNFFIDILKGFAKHKRTITIWTLSALSVLFFFFYGYIIAAFTGGFNTSFLSGKESSVDVLNLILPNQFIGKWFKSINPTVASIESVVALGFLSLILFIITIVQNLRKKVPLAYIVAISLILVLMFGLIKLPFLPEAGRLTILLSLAVGTYIALNLKITTKYMTVLIVLLLLCERFSYATYRDQILKPHFEIVKDFEGTAILNVPFNQFEAKRSILPYFYNKKITDGYFHFTAVNPLSTANFSDKYLSRFNCNILREAPVDENFQVIDIEKVVEFSRQNDIKYMVLHKDDNVGNLYYPGCENVLRWMAFITPKKVVIDANTNGVVKQDIVFSKDELGNANLQINGHGRLYFNDIFVYANKDVDVLVEGKFGKSQFKKKQDELPGETGTGLVPLVIDVVEGDEITLKLLDDDTTQVRYLTIYYAFDGVSASIKEGGYFNKVYEDKDVDIYKIY